MNWHVVIDNMPILAKGALLTLELTAGAVAIGVVIGLFMALARLSKRNVIRAGATAYIDFFRGTPLLVQIFLVYFGIPMLLRWQTMPDNYQYTAGILAMGLNSGAYIAEIFRAGIQSIDRGQTEAARSLGMTQAQALRYVILPQAFKRTIPPLGNEFIALLKDSSLLSIIAIQELFYTGKIIVGRTYQPLPMYLAVALYYLVMTQLIARWVAYMERRLGKNDIR
ncbi:amine acid ABC transporter, permease protein, 3-TM region, His/Glu/Gln/Arg/opine family [Desulfosporosinus orientis DSM 765]|uniref:Amine acid ABC transporter, permease protein, 3-TM region, His/Glu/Gln/Arg/opine family n=1 Tax=Desulfosporosinus orientis (strain ATCC 19365 / DSM 765 / NCIMB 8382 / VKM B-1628 / Singapore I) TaxID=768706 RepID=G7WGE0_DESOD|nr:amino acid ABC transporter permease [Desulfosporosinus orientis]AET70872.1 amine acid ABC transporter, permease protein, 3-TM region, His/Glu/Gln/Arg/opine family [Desulfosporosinus orientis DSM 765]